MVDLHVLTSIVNVELAHVDTNVMLVGQSIRDFGNSGELGQDLLLHEVESSLNGSRVILGEGITSDLLDTGMDGLVVNIAESGRRLGDKSPLTVNSSREDTIPNRDQSGVFISVETVESRTSSLEDEELVKTRGNADFVTSTIMVNTGGLDILTITDERVVVGLTINNETSPLVLDDINKSTRKVSILLQDMFSDLLTKDFNVINILATLGNDVDSVLAGIGGDNNRVIGLGVRGLDITFQQKSDLYAETTKLDPMSSIVIIIAKTYSEFGTVLNVTLLVDSHKTDEVLTVAGFLEVDVGVVGRHCWNIT